MKQRAGWQALADIQAPIRKANGKGYRRGKGQVIIAKRRYKFVKHRPIEGNIKTVTTKRDAANRLWICFSVVEDIKIEDEISTSKIGGFDFGLRTFLTDHTGKPIKNPEFFKQDLPRMRHIQKRVSKRVKHSKNQEKGKKHLARRHIRIADKRRNFHYQLAHELCEQYDILVFENLNIRAMKKLWGRKVSDLGFSKFLEIVKWVAEKRGKQVVQIDRWARTTGICSCCGHKQDMELHERLFCCENCGLVLDRDHNAAINIRELGHQLILSQLEEDRSEHYSGGIQRQRQKKPTS